MPVSYSYDASGNRVSKQAVVIAPMATAGRKSSPSSGKIAGSISGDVSIKGSPDGNTVTVLLPAGNDKGPYDIFLYTLSGTRHYNNIINTIGNSYAGKYAYRFNLWRF